MDVDPRLAELNELERDPEGDGGHIYDLMVAVGSDVSGLRVLVDRYGGSAHPLVPCYVAMALSRAAADWDPAEPALCDVVLDFIEAAGRGTNSGMLATTCGALVSLCVNDILEVDGGRRAALGGFLVHCLDQRNFQAPSACIELLDHLWSNGLLERVVTPSTVAALKDRLASLAVEDREEFREDLASLQGFWSES